VAFVVANHFLSLYAAVYYSYRLKIFNEGKKWQHSLKQLKKPQMLATMLVPSGPLRMVCDWMQVKRVVRGD